MDIMNNMTVSTSKLTFSLIAITALLVSGSTLFDQEASAFNAPEFTAKHINTTATHVTFNMSVNGTLALLDWGITILSTASAGDVTYDVIPTNISNATSSGIGQTTASAKDIAVSSVPAGVVGKGFLNGTDLVLIHPVIPTGATYYINYTNNALTPNPGISGGVGGFHTSQAAAGDCPAARCSEGSSTNKILKIGSNATALDQISPSVVSAKKTGPKKIEVLMSEPVGNINSTGIDFTLYGLHHSVVSSLIATNGTQTIYLTTQNLIDPINDTPVITLSYNSDADGDNVGIDHWITDAIDSTRYTNSGVAQSAEWLSSGHGNRLLNFTGLTVTYPADFVSDTQRYPPHIHDEVTVSVNSDKLYDLKIHDEITSNILAYVGDTISVTVSVGDDTFLNQISKAILITNYDNRPSDMNEYYSTNSDEMGQTGLSIYEWNQNIFDQNYDYAGIISWGETIVKIDKRIETYHEFVGPLLISENELFITYSMTFDDVMPKSQVGIKISDANYNNFESFLPFTLEVLPSDGIVNPTSIEEPIEESISPQSELVEITLTANNNSYKNGDKVIVTGQIKNYDFNSMKGKDIFYSVISPENVVLSSGQIGPNSDGSFYFTTFAMDNLWKTDGNYIFSVNLSSLKQTVDISYDNAEFEPLTFESELETTTAVPIIPDTTTAVPIIPDTTTAVPIIPDTTTAVPIIPDTTTAVPIIPDTMSELSNSNIICGTGTEDVDGICQVIQTKEKPSSGGGCLIATAAYGSEMSPQVQLLREIRDNQLMNTESGSAFMSTFNNVYYSFSPTIADMQRDSPIFKEIVKVGLTPMLSSLSIMENANSESEVLGLGFSVIMLNLGMYLGVPAMIVIGIRKKF
jgi:hypothetical protein